MLMEDYDDYSTYIKNYDEILESFADILMQLDKDMNRYQTDVYLYYDSDTQTATLDTFTNVGGNSWLDDSHITIYCDKEHYEDIFDYYEDIDSIAYALGMTKRELLSEAAYETPEETTLADVIEYVREEEGYYAALKEDYDSEAIDGHRDEYLAKAAAILEDREIFELDLEDKIDRIVDDVMNMPNDGLSVTYFSFGNYKVELSLTKNEYSGADISSYEEYKQDWISKYVSEEEMQRTQARLESHNLNYAPMSFDDYVQRYGFANDASSCYWSKKEYNEHKAVDFDDVFITLKSDMLTDSLKDLVLCGMIESPYFETAVPTSQLREALEAIDNGSFQVYGQSIRSHRLDVDKKAFVPTITDELMKAFEDVTTGKSQTVTYSINDCQFTCDRVVNTADSPDSFKIRMDTERQRSPVTNDNYTFDDSEEALRDAMNVLVSRHIESIYPTEFIVFDDIADDYTLVEDNMSGNMYEYHPDTDKLLEINHYKDSEGREVAGDVKDRVKSFLNQNQGDSKGKEKSSPAKSKNKVDVERE